MQGIQIPIGGDIAPLMAVMAEMRSEFRNIGKTMRGALGPAKASSDGVVASMKNVWQSTKGAHTGMRLLRTAAAGIRPAFTAMGNAARSAFRGLLGTLKSIGRGILSMGSKLRGLLPSFGMLGKIGGVVGLVGGFLSVRKAIRGFREALDMGGILSDMSARTGAAVADLAVLREAFKQGGLSADQVGPAFARMQRALSGLNEDSKPTADAFKALGLDIKKVRALNPAAQFEAVGKAIAALPSPAERAAAAMAIFGRAGAELLTVFRDGNAISLAAQNLGIQAQLLQKNATLFDRISDILGSAGNKVRGLFVGLADQLAPVLSPLLEAFDKLDLAGYGQALGAAIRGMLPSAQALMGILDRAKSLGKIIGDGIIAGLVLLRNGKTFELLRAGFAFAVTGAMDILMRGLRVAVAFLAGALPPLFQAASAKIRDPMFWEGLKSIFRGLGGTIAVVIQSAIADAESSLGKERAANQRRKLIAKDKARIEQDFFMGQAAITSSGQGDSFSDVLYEAFVKGSAAAAKAMKGPVSKSFKDARESLRKLLGSVLEEVARIRAENAVAPGEDSSRDTAGTGDPDNPTAIAGRSLGTLSTTLTRVGGSRFGMTFSPMITEQRRSNTLLTRIEKNTRGGTNVPAIV